MSTINKDEDKYKGLYPKYHVERVHDPKGKHKECFYFVLDVKHDKFADAAILAYAEACEKEYPDLAGDLKDMLDAKYEQG